MSIATLKQAIDLRALIAEYIPLKHVGRRWIACCPFHEEKTASFGIDDNRDHYKCFGCGASGDAITFVSEMDGVSVGQAIRYLAEKYGVNVGSVASGVSAQYDREERQFAEFWKKRTIDRLGSQLTEALHKEQWKLADAIGKVLQGVRALTYQELPAACLQAATEQDRDEWKYEQNFAAAWLALANQDIWREVTHGE